MSRTGRFFTAFLLTALVAAVFAGACAYNYVKESPAFPAVSEKSAEADGGQPRDAHTEDAVQSVPLACVMYHNILKSRKGTYIVSPSQFEGDLAAYRAAGYTTVFPSEVADFVYGNGALPEKPLLVTFDDGRYNNMYYGLPLLLKYGAKAVLCPVGAFSAFSTESGDHSNPNYSHVTWGQMDELQKSGCFELGNHSYNMHRYEPRFGIKRKAGESRAEYKEALRADAGRLQDEILRATGTLPVTYAYPFGAYCDDALAVLRSLGFRIFLTCNEGVSVIRRGAPETLFQVKRVNRDGALTSSEVVSRLEKFADKAAARGNA
ncbi:MAG TPA: polysaccharide deacetylase family protein [Candidatus Limadaptatus stercorigallinarum]|uniref:Polysaccharide deacetylase family protein n=1 Tax=Candidatus Limadaptatus stercorigallinarum TaxID=2840845 RepID=A0A9D1L2L3_9FIRM|nr:polysaccharide deacetylase family protein [Candidatus Limadaptatus stercorigallinarum]